MEARERKTWTVGVDPGFKETGVTFFGPSTKPLDWATYSCPPGEFDMLRAVALSDAVLDRIRRWLEKYAAPGDVVQVGIETPVYKHNAATLMLQLRLLEEIEAGIFLTLAGEYDVRMYEVNPVSSKLAFANNGRASKDEMVKAARKLWPIFMAQLAGPEHTVITVADALAHGYTAIVRAASGDHGIPLSRLRVAEVFNGSKAS